MPKAKRAEKKVATKAKTPTKGASINQKISKSSKKAIPSKSTKAQSRSYLSNVGTRAVLVKDQYLKALKTSNRVRIATGVAIVIVLFLLVFPHLTVAWVDDRPITIFAYYNQLDQKYGKDTKDQMINEQLIEDEARSRGVAVSNQEVQSQINTLEQQASGSANLDSILAQQGMTRTDFEEQIRLQTLIKKMFSSEASVSSKEVDDYIAQNKSQLPDPVDAQTRSSIKDQLQQQKLVQVFQNWLQSASNSNRVIRL